VTLSAYPDRVLRGRVSSVSDVLESDSRRDKVRIAVPNADYSLRPNMFASVSLLAAAATQVIVPTSALLMNNDRTSVFVATAPWTFSRRVVDMRLGEGSTAVILGGLKAGEQVVVKGGILLND
jgi:cobalt-zinc-cadmium efflux system membrane fusion protein